MAPALGVQAALQAATRGHVTGLDHSRARWAAASRRNAAAIASGRAQLLLGDAQDPPDGIGASDAIFGCNVWTFWPDPVVTLGRLADLLRPEGRLAIIHQPRGASAGPASSAAAADQIEAQLLQAGMTNLQRSQLDLRSAPAVCVIAQSSAWLPDRCSSAPGCEPADLLLTGSSAGHT